MDSVYISSGAAELSVCLPVCLSIQVSVNGQHFLHYHYRLPLSRVDTLGIFGNILVEAIGFLNINVSSLGASVSSLNGNCPRLPLMSGWAQDHPLCPRQALSHQL